jgi:CRISP-associated protein Cas1
VRTDLRSLPRIRDSWSFAYVEHARVEQDGRAIVAIDVTGRTVIPCASLALVMLGPGTTVTHAAIKNMADCGTQIIWTGEDGVRLYAHGLGHARSARLLQRQALLSATVASRLRVARRMYLMRFPGDVPADADIKRLRGMEGVRVREAYAAASRATGVPWHGRRYVPGKPSASDPVNLALSAANACLYGICHAAIVSVGLAPGLGFIHVGRSQSFVYDIADLYKCETAILAAFQAAAEDPDNAHNLVRTYLRDHFSSERLLVRIVGDIMEVLDVQLPDEDEVDPAGALWDPGEGNVASGMNYGQRAADQA